VHATSPLPIQNRAALQMAEAVGGRSPRPFERLPPAFGLRQPVGHGVQHDRMHGHARVAADDLDALALRAAGCHAALPCDDTVAATVDRSLKNSGVAEAIPITASDSAATQAPRLPCVNVVRPRPNAASATLAAKCQRRSRCWSASRSRTT
jgi:hypothetical protein